MACLTGLSLCLTLTGCGGGGGGTSSGLIAGSNPLLNSGSYNGSYNPNLVSQFVSSPEYANVSRYDRDGGATLSSLHPYTLTNVHEAYGYGLSGAGTKIAVLDTGFNTPEQLNTGLIDATRRAFPEALAKKTSIEFVGTIRDASGDSYFSGTPNHGAMVASIAAAGYNGDQRSFYADLNGGTQYPFRAFADLDYGMMGVAPGAGLVLADYLSVNGSLSGIASLTTDLANRQAQVLNNSWGLTHPATGSLLTLPANLPANISTMTTRQATEWLWAAIGQPFSATDWTAYHDALERFQRSGVVVFALQNTNDAQPSLMASLPSVYVDLKPAWIAVGNIDTRGTSRSNLTVSPPLSAACGAAAEYCVVVDAQQITGSGIEASRGYSPGLSGASLAAPQVSGMVALLSQAFAGQGLTPADIAGRLLATSYNGFSGFSRAGTRDFGNGVTHDYSSSYGHGIPDMQAALQPIVSNTVPLAFITNGSPRQGVRVPVQSSGLITSHAFGDSVSQGLKTVSLLSFDAMGGGFPVAMSLL